MAVNNTQANRPIIDRFFCYNRPILCNIKAGVMNLIFRFLLAESSDKKDPDYTKSGLNPPFHSSAGQRYRQPNIKM